MEIKKLCKVLCVLLALLLLTGCGKQAVDGETDPGVTTEGSSDTTGQEEDTQQTTAGTDTTETTQATETTAATEEDPASLGQTEDGTYTNQYIGVGCKPEDGWQLYGVQQLQELSDDALKMLESGEISGALETYPQIYDMMLQDSTGLHSVNVLYTKLSISDRLVYAAMDETQLIDTMLSSQYDLLVDGYTAEGYQVQKLEKKSVTFLGETHAALYIEATLNGENCYILQLFDYWQGQYGVTVTFNCTGENKTQDMLEMFYKV